MASSGHKAFVERSEMVLIDYCTPASNVMMANSVDDLSSTNLMNAWPREMIHSRASSMYSTASVISDATTATTTTTTSSDSELDLNGLVEGLVDEDDDDDEEDDDMLYMHPEGSELSHQTRVAVAPSPQHAMLREALEKDPVERSQEELDTILNFVENISAFNKWEREGVKRQMCSAMVLAIIEQPGTVILTHLEVLDSFCCLIHGNVEHQSTSSSFSMPSSTIALGTATNTINETIPSATPHFGHSSIHSCSNNQQQQSSVNVKILQAGDVFGITDPTLEVTYFDGIMKTLTPYCWFLCISQQDFHRILNQTSEYCRHEEDGQVVLITEHRSVDSNRKGHIIVRGTPERLLLGLLGCDSNDAYFIDDFILTYRVFMPMSTLHQIKTNDSRTLTKTDKATQNTLLICGMEQICSKLLSWFDEQHFRDKVIRIVLTWINNYYVDFDNGSANSPSVALKNFGQSFLDLFEVKLSSVQSLSTQLRLLHIALSTKAKVRQLTLTRSNREDDVLHFQILGGYERGYGIFVSKVETGSKAEQLGLRRGDQILEVNGTNFMAITHCKALEVLRATTHLSLTIKYNPFMYKEMICAPDCTSKSKRSGSTTTSTTSLPLTPVIPTSQSSCGQFVPTSPSIFSHKPHNYHSQQKFSTQLAGGGTKLKKAIPKFANFISRHLTNINDQLTNQIILNSRGVDEVDNHNNRLNNQKNSLLNVVSGGSRTLSTRSHSNPDLFSSSTTLSPLFEPIPSVSTHPQHVVRVFNAASGDSRYLLIHAETTAREVVMVGVREFGLCNQSSGGKLGIGSSSNGPNCKSSLNYALYEMSVVPQANTIKQRRLPDQMSGLAERAGLHSRYYIKENVAFASGQSGASQSQTSIPQGNQLPDDLANEIIRECPMPITLLSLNTHQIGIQLTLQDFDVFRSIEPQEFIYDLFGDEIQQKLVTEHRKGDAKLDADKLRTEIDQQLTAWTKKLHEFEDISNKEMFWVVSEILSEPSLVKRVKLIKCFVKIASVCRSLHNYNSMFAILSGLGHGSVQRLKQTWDKVPRGKYRKTLKALQKLMDPTRNMGIYRAELSQCHPPIIPFFPIVKKDLTFIHLAHATKSEVDGLVNFEKMRIISKEIRHIVNMSSHQYHDSIVPPATGAHYRRRNTTVAAPGTRSTVQAGGNPTLPLLQSVPLPPPPPVVWDKFNSVGQTAATPKRMYEEALMRKKVKHYLEEVFANINYDEDALLAKSCELEAGPTPPQTTPQSTPNNQHLAAQKPMCKSQPSPTLSSASSGSSGGMLLKFGAESPQQLRKLMSLSEVDGKSSSSSLLMMKHKATNVLLSNSSTSHQPKSLPVTGHMASASGLHTLPGQMSHMRSVSEGSNILMNTVSFQNGYPLRPAYYQSGYPYGSTHFSSGHHATAVISHTNHASVVNLPVESSSVTSLRRLDQLQQIKSVQSSNPPQVGSYYFGGADFVDLGLPAFPKLSQGPTASSRPPPPNYDETIQRHNCNRMVSISIGSSAPPTRSPLTTLVMIKNNTADTVSDVEHDVAECKASQDKVSAV